MNRVMIFEDSAPFQLVIKQSVQKTPPANSSLFSGDPDSTLGVGAWGGSKPLEIRNKV